MTSNAKIGAAVVGGYVLGRRKKAKIALGLGMVLAGAGARRRQPAQALSESPIVGTVNERLRGELMDAGKAAATTVLAARADKLADAIHDRTEELRDKDHEADESGETERADEAAEADEASEGTEGTEDTEDTEDKKPSHTGTTRARKTAKRRAKTSASGTRKRSADDG